MNMKNGVFLFLLACETCLASAVELREYPCHYLSLPPVVDGDSGDQCWQTIPHAGGFFILGATNVVTAKPTSFRLGWTSNALYLAANCAEPALDKLTVKARDGGECWTDDSIELFVLPAGVNTSFLFIATAAGARWNGRAGNAEPSRDWEVRTATNQTGWCLEARLPFSIFNQVPADGQRWRFNFARNLLTGPGSERHSCWPFLKKNFHETDNFGILIFKAAQLTGCEVAEIEKQLYAPYRAFMRKQIETILNEIGPYRQDLVRFSQTSDLQKDVLPLKKAVDEIDRLAGQANPDPKEVSAAIRAYRDNNNILEKVKDFHYELLLESLF